MSDESKTPPDSEAVEGEVVESKSCPPDFHVIGLYDRYGLWDRLDGRDLESGEWIEVLWKDGTRSVHNVYIEKTARKFEEGTAEFEIPDHRAYVYVEHHGSLLQVALRHSNLYARRVIRANSDWLLEECVACGANRREAARWLDHRKRRFIEEKRYPKMIDDASEATAQAAEREATRWDYSKYEMYD